MENINSVVLTGNLTRDVELVDLPSGSKLANMRVAVNSRVKSQGEWADKANYIDVVTFGGQAEACKTHLAKGSPIAISGRLDWNEWTDRDGNARQGLKVVAASVQFLPSGQRSSSDGGGGDAPPVSAAADGGDEDIPF